VYLFSKITILLLIKDIKFNIVEYFIFGRGKLVNLTIDYLLNSNVQKIYVVPEIPEPEWMDSVVEHCNKKDIQTLNFEDIFQYTSNQSIGVSIYFSKIFRKIHIENFKYLINLHNGPLPKYRGVNPVNWALKNNEKTHGVTLHYIDQGIDSGDIIDQEHFSINQNLEVIDVYNLCLQAGEKILKRSILNIENIKPIKQDNKEATYYSKVDFEKLGDRKFFTRNES